MGAVEMCGRVVWPDRGTPAGTRRLYTAVLGPEYYDGRELVVHADADAAVEAMAEFRRAARTAGAPPTRCGRSSPATPATTR